jgi:hypothetical protein
MGEFTNEEKREQQVREITRRLSTSDRREVERYIDENKTLKEENRRLLADRRGGGDSNVFETLFVLSIIVFIVAVVGHFSIPLYLDTQRDITALEFSRGMGLSYEMIQNLKNLVMVSNIGMIISAPLGIVSWFLKKK